MSNQHITLKWGTLKSWNLEGNEKAIELLKKYKEIGMSTSAMYQDDTPEQKELICKMIDECDCETIFLDWDYNHVSKEEAKKYVMEYSI